MSEGQAYSVPGVSFDVVVIGSVNHDISVLAPRLPRPGESITGTDHFYGPGGKGANQAVAAARLGSPVAMVGRVGDDEHGAALVSGLRSEGVEVSAMGIDDDASTGIAVITIDAGAENTIVVSPGANMRLGPAHVREHAELIAGASVVLAQLEVPLETITAAAEIATGTFCLNPAPARAIPEQLLERVDVLVPNRSELALLAEGEEPTTGRQAADAARRLGHGGATVVTLGAGGAVLVDADVITLVPAPDVDPVDPTGAGDAFSGALAHSLSRGGSLVEAVGWAVAAGAAATTRRGAQAAMPTADEVEALLTG